MSGFASGFPQVLLSVLLCVKRQHQHYLHTPRELFNSPVMAGWLATKIRNTKIRTHVNMTEELFLAMTPRERAYVSLHSGLFRMADRRGELGDSSISNVLDNPFACDPLLLEETYNTMDKTLFVVVGGIEQTERNHERVCGEKLPRFAKSHKTASINMNHLWVVTLAAGLVPETRQRANAVWALMRDSHDQITQAIQDWRDTMRQFQQLFGGGLDETPPEDEWAMAARYIPSAFSFG